MAALALNADTKLSNTVKPLPPIVQVNPGPNNQVNINPGLNNQANLNPDSTKTREPDTRQEQQPPGNKPSESVKEAGLPSQKVTDSDSDSDSSNLSKTPPLPPNYPAQQAIPVKQSPDASTPTTRRKPLSTIPAKRKAPPFHKKSEPREAEPRVQDPDPDPATKRGTRKTSKPGRKSDPKSAPKPNSTKPKRALQTRRGPTAPTQRTTRSQSKRKAQELEGSQSTPPQDQTQLPSGQDLSSSNSTPQAPAPDDQPSFDSIMTDMDEMEDLLGSLRK
ncbi:hypothetical protein TWF730_006592 [Orbilia blumenaviensis]|uniref:Uncharacterized protein n=1 Tax=Orbilia blumenaviensis TaxID=1796055 RepID=A0AAV9VEP7_9PEZI